MKMRRKNNDDYFRFIKTRCWIKDDDFQKQKNNDIWENVLEKLDNPEKVDFAYKGDYLIISAEATSRYTLRNLHGKKVLYRGKLIREILDHFEIEYNEDFYKAFSEVEKIEGQGNTVSIKMKNESGEQ